MLGSGGLLSYLIMFSPFILLIFLLFSNQKRKKEQQGMINGLEIGDKITTIGGIMGVVSKVSDTTIEIKIDDKAKLTLTKSAVARKDV